MKKSKKIMALLLVLMMAAAPVGACAQGWSWWPFGQSDQPVSAPAQMPEEAPTPAPVNTPAPTPVSALQGVLPAPVQPVQRQTQQQDTVRVLLKSISGNPALTLTLYGSYAVENNPGLRFQDGAQITVAIQDHQLYMQAGGLVMAMGETLTLTRHQAKEGQENGAVIHETGRENLYCGHITLNSYNGYVQAIVTMSLEEYLYGVVPYEMADSFPLEALKAQAVAARTYAMGHLNPEKEYDVVDTPANQTFKGLNRENKNAILAVDETKGVVGMYGEKYAACNYTASNGGYVETASHIWGGANPGKQDQVKADPYDLENPKSMVKSLTLSADPAQWDDTLLSALKSGLTEQMSARGYSDEMEDIQILAILSMAPANPKYPDSPMYQSIRVGMQVQGKKLYKPDPTPNAQTQPLNQQEILPQTLYADLDVYGLLKPAYGLGMNSMDCEVVSVSHVPAAQQEQGEDPGSFLIESRRYGHGVGLSQRGAQQMAQAHNAQYSQILAFYYPGMDLVCMDYQTKALSALEDLPATLGLARPKPTPRPTPKPLPALNPGERYASIKLESAGSTLNVRQQPGTQAPIAGTLDHNQRLIVIGEIADGWAQIKTTELEGYCSAAYLVFE